MVWDGVNAHVVLFGVQDEEIDFPQIGMLDGETEDEEETEELIPFSDVDYEDPDEDLPEYAESDALTKTHWGADSK